MICFVSWYMRLYQGEILARACGRFRNLFSAIFKILFTPRARGLLFRMNIASSGNHVSGCCWQKNKEI